jgi:hypothetical protein
MGLNGLWSEVRRHVLQSARMSASNQFRSKSTLVRDTRYPSSASRSPVARASPVSG